MQANIKHEEIKGFMAAMTMPYKVRDAKEFANLKPGDLINSTLVVVSNDAYLKNVKKVGEAPLASEAPAPAASSGFELLRPGEAVPDVPMLDQDGRKTSISALKGQTVVLTFIYTQCPLPTFCPLMDRHFVAIQDRLKGDPTLSEVHLATVSFDPVIDTPPVLKKHAQQLGADLTRWTFFTGDRDDIDKFASRFGVTIARDTSDPKNITHNLRTVIIDADGKLKKTYTGNEWSPDQILADLK
jgi:protein SCO1/2